MGAPDDRLRHYFIVAISRWFLTRCDRQPADFLILPAIIGNVAVHSELQAAHSVTAGFVPGLFRGPRIM
jgi:hypothetical protein